VATIRDVARAAEVSIATVSRVLNGSPKVSEDTRRRVWEVATGLDYWPHGAARSLTTSRTHTLGVLLPDLFGEFFSEVIRGIDSAARSHGLQLLLSSSHAEARDVIAAAGAMRGRIDGLVVMAPDGGTPDALERVRQRFPLVLLNPRTPVEGCSSVSIANLEGAHAAVRHLIALGHQRIAIVNGPAGNADAQGRLAGYRRALREAHLPRTPELEFAGDFTESGGYLECARDVAVVGFDDIASVRYLDPPLTTVHVDTFELGERAVRLLVAAMESPSSRAQHEVLPATLVVRRSCGAPAGDGDAATLASRRVLARGGDQKTMQATAGSNNARRHQS
jgi:LacI family transcriptional regulator